MGKTSATSAGRHRRRLNGVAALFAAMFVSATLLALVAALSVGTVFGAGVLVVASAFGFCSVAGYPLDVLALDQKA